jgi:hypothetical protein
MVGAVWFRDQLGIELRRLAGGCPPATLFEADLAPSVNHRLCVRHAGDKPTVERRVRADRHRPMVYDMELELSGAEAAAVVDAGASC